MSTSPAAVSAKLRKAGFGIVATRNREGIRVARGGQDGTVKVTVDLDRENESNRLANTLAEHLATWDGYTTSREGARFTITKN